MLSDFRGGSGGQPEIRDARVSTVLVRLRQGDTDREVARTRLMGRRKTAAVREAARERGWLDAETPLPDDATLAAAFAGPARRTSNVSTLEPHRERIRGWWDSGIQGTTIHAALRRNHGYTGSYSAVRRLLQGFGASQPAAATTRLDFAPGEAAQVDALLRDGVWNAEVIFRRIRVAGYDAGCTILRLYIQSR